MRWGRLRLVDLFSTALIVWIIVIVRVVLTGGQEDPWRC